MTRTHRPEVLADVAAADLSGRTALVTGGTSGIGREVALALARLGADVHVQGRNRDAGRAVVADAEAAGANARFHRADFLALDDVRGFASTVADAGVDVAVLAAGAHFADGRRTDAGVERTFQVNHLAHFLLVERLRPLPADARVVVVASEVHRRGSLDESLSAATDVSGYDGFGAYADSKLANVLYARELDARLDDAAACSCHPGFVPSSGLWRRARLPVRVLMRALSAAPQVLVDRVVDTPAQAAATPTFLAAGDAVRDDGGAYFEDCERTAPASRARDDALAAALWSWSETRLD